MSEDAGYRLAPLIARIDGPAARAWDLGERAKVAALTKDFPVYR